MAPGKRLQRGCFCSAKRRQIEAAVSEAIRVTGMYTYGRVELEPRGAPPPPGWEELMLAMHHQEPVGRCFQR